MLRILAVEDDIGQKVYSLAKVFLSYGSLEHSVLLIGKGIQLTAHTL